LTVELISNALQSNEAKSDVRNNPRVVFLD